MTETITSEEIVTATVTNEDVVVPGTTTVVTTLTTQLDVTETVTVAPTRTPPSPFTLKVVNGPIPGCGLVVHWEGPGAASFPLACQLSQYTPAPLVLNAGGIISVAKPSYKLWVRMGVSLGELNFATDDFVAQQRQFEPWAPAVCSVDASTWQVTCETPTFTANWNHFYLCGDNIYMGAEGLGSLCDEVRVQVAPVEDPNGVH